MPKPAYEILRQQLTTLVHQPSGALGLGVAVGILITLWSANKGMKALMTALNIVYGEKESRSFFKLNAISLLLTFCAIVLGLIAVAAVVAVPALIGSLGLRAMIQAIFIYLRWPLLAIFGVFALAVGLCGGYHRGKALLIPKAI
jgi:membrane protein